MRRSLLTILGATAIVLFWVAPAWAVTNPTVVINSVVGSNVNFTATSGTYLITEVDETTTTPTYYPPDEPTNENGFSDLAETFGLAGGLGFVLGYSLGLISTIQKGGE